MAFYIICSKNINDIFDKIYISVSDHTHIKAEINISPLIEKYITEEKLSKLLKGRREIVPNTQNIRKELHIYPFIFRVVSNKYLYINIEGSNKPDTQIPMEYPTFRLFWKALCNESDITTTSL